LPYVHRSEDRAERLGLGLSCHSRATWRMSCLAKSGHSALARCQSTSVWTKPPCRLRSLTAQLVDSRSAAACSPLQHLQPSPRRRTVGSTLPILGGSLRMGDRTVMQKSLVYNDSSPALRNGPADSSNPRTRSVRRGSFGRAADLRSCSPRKNQQSSRLGIRNIDPRYPNS
jgi:hypothetical protein